MGSCHDLEMIQMKLFQEQKTCLGSSQVHVRLEHDNRFVAFQTHILQYQLCCPMAQAPPF